MKDFILFRKGVFKNPNSLFESNFIIITNLNDINNFKEISDELRIKIIESLSQSQSVDTIKPILNIPILLLYECDITKSEKTFSKEYKNSIVEFHKNRAESYFKKQINKCDDVHLYDKIKFHLILFPIANKKIIVEKFIQKAKVFRD